MSSETEEVAQFRPIDLPYISVNSDFDSSEYSDLDEGNGYSTPTTPATSTSPTTPATPLSDLASSVSSLAFTEAETSTFALPATKRAYRKKRPGFRKDHSHSKRRLFSTGTPTKKSSLAFEIHTSYMVPKKTKSHQVFLKKGDKTSARQLYVPHGSEVMNMDILGHVMSLLRCDEPDCYGSMILHNIPKTNGLQSYFILHCRRCHTVVAELSSSPDIGETPKEAVNNPKMSTYRPNQVNSRALLTVHSTSLSWRDFLLVCAVMDLPVPGRNLNKLALENFQFVTKKLSHESMALAAAQIRSRESSVTSNIPGAYKCDVSFDATWHRRGHYSKQGFSAAIDIVSNKVLDYMLYQRVCRKCLSWPNERRLSQPDDYAAFFVRATSLLHG